MSARGWKPGDVALVRNEWNVWNVAICSVKAGQRGFVWQFGVSDAWEKLDAEARVLVVIDPEDAEQVERLSAIYEAQPFSESEIEAMQAALRAFASATPPRCPAHGDPACALCSRIAEDDLEDGSCRHCGYYAGTGMHWDTCPGRIRGRIFVTSDEAKGATT